LLQITGEFPIEGSSTVIKHPIPRAYDYTAFTLDQTAFALQLEAEEKRIIGALRDVLTVMRTTARD
jgi:hypothetical protein